MRIVITSNYRIGNESGSARIAETLSAYLSNNNVVLYLCLGSKYNFKKINENLSRLEIPSVPVKQGFIPKLTPSIIQKVFEQLDIFSPEIIHAQNVVFIDLICLIWAIEKNVAYVVTFHAIPSEGITYMFPNLSKNKVVNEINYSITKSYMKRILENVNLIIALNNYVQKSVLSITRKTKTIVINNGLDLKPFLELEPKTPETTKIFTYIGSYIVRKNQEFLVRVFSYLPKNYHFHLYGNMKTGESYVKKLQKLIKEKNIKNLKIRDFIDRQKLYRVLEYSDYFISASLKEAQSLVIIEALASATPVIGLKNETIHELIDVKNGLSLPAKITPRLFAQKIQTYVENNEKRYYNTTEYCRETVKKFEIESVAPKIIRAYRIALKIKSKKVTKNVSEITQILPSQLQEIIKQSSTFLKRPKPIRLQILLGISMILVLLSWPILNIINLSKTKLAPALKNK